MKNTLSLLLLCALASAAHADHDLLTFQYEACKARSASTVDMQTCIEVELSQQDARLNLAYKDVLADLRPARAKQLLEAQRAWLKFRDANCNFYLDPQGGAIASVRANRCTLDQTASRVKELEDMLK